MYNFFFHYYFIGFIYFWSSFVLIIHCESTFSDTTQMVRNLYYIQAIKRRYNKTEKIMSNITNVKISVHEKRVFYSSEEVPLLH